MSETRRILSHWNLGLNLGEPRVSREEARRVAREMYGAGICPPFKLTIERSRRA